MVRRLLWLFPVILLGLIPLAFAILARPFSREAMTGSLGDALASKVVFGTFRRTYFPALGFVATNVSILPKQGWAAGHAEAASLRAEASWSGLLSHEAALITADRLTVSVRSLGERVFVGNLGTNRISKLQLRRATLRLGDKQFDFHNVVLRNVAAGRQIGYELAVAIPRPRGELILVGQLGPFHRREFARTELRGSYALSRAGLGVFQGLAGTLSSQGTFSGPLSKITFQGSADVPDFEVTQSGHRHRLTTRFQALVDATTGDTVINDVGALLDRTSLAVSGRIASRGTDKSKTISLNIESRQGRIQDLMLLFVKTRESPILGPIGFRAQIVLPPGDEIFKRRVELTGQFGIHGAGFTSADTQQSVDALSVRAEGQPREDPERVLSDLSGHVVLHAGLARLTDVRFCIPGAAANLSGTFNLMTERVDLHGQLNTDAKLSKTTTGIKSLFLKVLDPVFKGKHAGAVIPVALTGKYGATHFHEILVK